MKKFLGRILAALTAMVLFSMLIIIIIFLASNDKPTEIKENTVLKIQLTGPIQERVQKDFWDIYFPSSNDMRPEGLDQILLKISQAKDDDRIKGLYLYSNYAFAGISTIDEIRDALIEFKRSGKFIYAYSEFYTKKGYYLSSLADSIFMHPGGALEFTGVKSEVLFYHSMLKKLKIEPQVIRTGKWKSYAEQFLLDSLSQENRTQISNYITDVWNHMLETMADDRGISVQKLNDIAQELLVAVPNDALHQGLIDGLKFHDQMDLLFEKQLGDEWYMIDLSQYESASKELNQEGPCVGIVYAHGEVQMGKGEEGTIGAERIAKAIKAAREDDDVKAIVLRVNSGGGSALASDIIWREMQLTKGIKPVIASIGDIAASGGYYIMASADTIIGRKAALTGSIGVVGMLFNTGPFFEEWLGITRDVVKTNEHADLTSPYKPLSEMERAKIRAMIVQIYDDFLSRVASGREMTKEEVRALAMGQIYSGVKAKQIDLIDMYGGIKESVELAANKAGISTYSIKQFPNLDIEDAFFGALYQDVRLRMVKQQYPELDRAYDKVRALLKSGPYQARMPYDIEIK